MKRILPAGERYGLFFAQPDRIKVQKNFFDYISKILFKKFNPLFFITVFLTVSFTHFSAESNAQIAGANKAHNEFRKENFPTKYYQVGDKLPKNFVLGYNPFDSTEVFTLADYRGKAVILDMWATWCGSCISAFPKVDSLNKLFKPKMEFLLINLQQLTPESHGDNPEKVRLFINNYIKRIEDFSPVFVIERNRLDEFFLFAGIPHYIWIDRNRRIRAITNAKEINRENIEKLLHGRPMDLPIKKR